MQQVPKPEADHIAQTRDKVLDAALPIVPFDGWTDRTLGEAVRDSGVDPGLSRLAFPRGGVDLALAYHARGDAALRDALAAADLGHLRYSERVARAIEMRLEFIAGNREAVRRAAALFALPIHAADGARAIWRTADAIWDGLGDTSRDINWYTKRTTLSAVYSSVLIYWLGDETPGFGDTREFIARRIDNVMQFEKFKSSVRNSPIGRIWDAGPGKFAQRVRAPHEVNRDMPGRWDRSG